MNCQDWYGRLQGWLDHRLTLSDAPISLDGLSKHAALISIGPGQCVLESLDGIQLKLTPSKACLHWPDSANLELFLRAFEIRLRAAWYSLQGKMVLRASAVLLPDKTAALWCGPTAAGKTLIACYAALRQYPLISDEISCLLAQDGKICVQSNSEPPKVAPCGWEALQRSVTGLSICKQESGYARLELPQVNGTFPVSGIFCMQTSFVDGVTSQQVSGLDQFPILFEQLLPFTTTYLLAPPTLMQYVFDLGTQASLYRIQRPVKGDVLPQLFELMNECTTHD